MPTVLLERSREQSGPGWKRGFYGETLAVGSKSLPSQLLSFVTGGRRRTWDYAYDYHAAPTDDHLDSVLEEQQIPVVLKPKRVRGRSSLKGALLRLPFVVLMLLGILHIILVLLGKKSLLWDLQGRGPSKSRSGSVGDDLSSYPTDSTRGIIPIPCHSHNDYWRRVPLLDAIHVGCTSVEADVWLLGENDELLVGHNTASLTRNRTFTNLYVKPLVNLLEKMNPTHEFSNGTRNGIFDEDPEQTLVLLVDFKTDGHDLFPHVQRKLEPLREKKYLSYWNGKDFVPRAITVVGTGNTPFDLVLENSDYRDIFFDAPLDKLWEPLDHSKNGGSQVTSSNEFNISNSYYASVSFGSTIGIPWTGRLTKHQLDRIRGQIRGAQRRGLKARYWGTPAWPTSLRNYVWRVLVEEGVDMLNVDDLQAAANQDWTAYRKHDWVDA